MEIKPLQSEFVKIYSEGIEEIYKGETIVYNDKSKVFVYYYYQNSRRVYVLTGKDGNIELPYIENNVKVIFKLENRKCDLFRRFVKTTDKAMLYSLSDEFYTKLYILIMKKRPILTELIILYKKYIGATSGINNYY